MIHRALLCLVGLCFPLFVHGQEVHKCETPDGITYQSFPCEGREAAMIIVAKPADTPNARTTADCGARPDPTSRLLWRRTALCIGMTDDEVLNLPGWGRPAKIVRTRAQRVWREQWLYDARADAARQLHFVNGKLALIETAPVETRFGSTLSLSSQ